MADAGASYGGKSHERGEQSHHSEVPIKIITRIMKEAVDADWNIDKDAKEFMQKSVSEFIRFITRKTKDKCLEEKRKTVTEDDLISTMKTLKFQHYFDGVMAIRADADARSGGKSHEGQQSSHSDVREEDLFLPMAKITRIMKKGISEDGNISKEAKELVKECVSKYISFITSKANDKCKKESRAILNGDDLISALETHGFQDCVDPLRAYLKKYREMTGSATGGDGSASKVAVGASSSIVSQIAHQDLSIQDMDLDNPELLKKVLEDDMDYDWLEKVLEDEPP